MAGLFDAHLARGARAFYGLHPSDAGDRASAIRRAARPLLPQVADALESQAARHPPSPARQAHLASLRRGAAAVVTGQQVGLFLGPLYTVYKAASAVVIARALAAESGLPVVPVFWLQTEDHDLPEIASCHVPRARGEALTLSLPASPASRVSIEHLTLPAAVTDCLARLRAELAPLPCSEEHLLRLEHHYRPGNGWAAAFAGVLAELFAPEGLVLVDPRDPALGEAAALVHRKALTAAGPISEALAGRVAELEAAGYSASVQVRAGAPLSFFHPAGPSGPRHRLEPDGSGALVEVGGSGSHTLAELLATLEAQPLAFSTSALLRPILQDSLLPTAAYVGGPGEVAYFAQLAPLYAAFELALPLVVPRARLRVIERPVRKLLDRFGLAPDEARLAEDELLARCRPAGDADLRPEALTRALLEPLVATLEAARPALAQLGPGLDQAATRTQANVEQLVRKFAAKVERARLHADEGLVDDVRRLKLQLFPEDAPQERHHGISYFAARHGERAFLERVLDAIVPFDFTPRDIE